MFIFGFWYFLWVVIITLVFLQTKHISKYFRRKFSRALVWWISALTSLTTIFTRLTTMSVILVSIIERILHFLFSVYYQVWLWLHTHNHPSNWVYILSHQVVIWSNEICNVNNGWRTTSTYEYCKWHYKALNVLLAWARRIYWSVSQRLSWTF